MWFRLRSFTPKPPYRVGIRAQLTMLVSIVAIISLVILAVTTGVYFTSNYKNLRSDRLYIAAQLKSSQIDQNLNYLYYQCYWVASRDTLQTGLANYVAGNKSDANWMDSQSVLEKFLGSSNLFSVARVYDSSFTTVLNTTNNSTGDLIPEDVLTQLLPLSTNVPLPSSLETNGIVTNPVKNGSSYLMSMSLPIFANPSIILTDSRVYGYVTVVMSAEGLLSVFNDTTALERSYVAIVSAVYTNATKLDAYRFVFPPFGSTSSILNETFPLNNNTFLSSALRQGKGGALKSTRLFYRLKLAVGYSPSTSNLANWVAIVAQAESVFISPATKLAKIIAGTVVGIGVFAMLITFPLAHWAVKPIVRLQKATELITESRGLRPTTPTSGSRANSILRDKSSLISFPLHPVSTNNINNNNSNEKAQPPSDQDTNTNNSSSSIAVSNIREEHSPHADGVFSGISLSNVSDRLERLSNTSKHYTTAVNLIQARVPSYRALFKDELSDLTETFNTMTDALDQHYALLEERVRARTKQLEAAKIEAETANEAKTVFIANISHELRTPLNGILGMTAISMEETDIDKIRNSLKLIFRSGELLLHILTELLTFSKNVLKRTKLEKRNFCITDVALQIKSIFGKVAKDQHVRLSIILSPNMIRSMVLYGDSNRIIQIVMNLVSNALKFTPVDGKVDVRMKVLGLYDEALSEKYNHNKVYVKPGTEITDSTPSLNVKSEGQGKDKFTSDTASKNNTSSDTAYDATPTTDRVAQESDEDNMYEDNESMISSTTSSYDDAIFNSQFKKTTNLYDEDDESEMGVELETPKTWVISFEVEDSGPGIDKGLQESVFEPFVQGDQTLSRQYGGTGLGLSICRQLAGMMKGKMLLESKVGVGSKFTFTLPLTQTREINFANVEDPFEDEFNAKSKKNRKVKFRMARSLNSRKSRSSIVTAGASSHHSVHTRTPTKSPRLKCDRSVSDRVVINSPERTGENITFRSESDDHLSHMHRNRDKDHERLSASNSTMSLDRPFLQSTGTATSTRSIPHLSSFKEEKPNDPLLNVSSSAEQTKKTSEGNGAYKILVAEDNHVNQEVIKRMLQLEGVKDIDLACDGQDAFDKVKQLQDKGSRYNLIFMDVQMPKVDGLTSTKMIRHDLHCDFPIVALTAFADDSNIKECLDAGMDGFLSKPIKRTKLKTILKEFCSDEREEDSKPVET
ncbi:histidine kinase KNAG_0L02110 [Huiozyma naganishii CBS 8797]|uniref:histidine kinase n=1 Tax=Huiozyma naganishii (strain ATCC MYA-139 / BCRC 22969 / CBS 8797 / KCTC 17520 / NBRC 10181 / NCYC 3082 / Yp74L-3) TaxID=1071383 RepID=J7SAK7_HUIN7|nr:hypothetical protein KNAG_0L02110 [Kazachstania naganishii CBS 8797]CCK72829.1 hypothetical protein KNAG_0L02110 [Kazachstania naganishii CBS 8797]